MGMAKTESQCHVLAVDDSIIDRKLIERLLKTSSYQVTTVDSGSKALQFLGLHEHDPNIPSVSLDNHQEVEVNLVITDYCMPGMTGYDLLKKIKESSSLRDIPVVIMSSENVPSRINRCLEEGAEEFFLKPVRLADVNRLKPHIMRTKSKDLKQEKEELESERVLRLHQESAIQELHLQQQESAKPEIHLQLQESVTIPEVHIQLDRAKLELQSQLQQLPEEQSNKRKTLEEGISPADRTRRRFAGLTTMV